MPEAATWLINRGILPEGGEHATLEQVLPFQRQVLAMASEFEDAAQVWAAKIDARLIVADRGRLDGMAYLPVMDQARVFSARLSVDVDQLCGKYDEVVHLASES